MKIAKNFTATNLDELLLWLKEVRSWSDEQVYDVVLIAHMWAAVLENLRQHSLETELEIFTDVLDDNQKLFLAKIVQHSKK